MSRFAGRRACAGLAALVVFVVLAAGCAAPLQKPDVSLAGVDLIGLGLVEQRLLLKLNIRNPNDVDLPIEALSFDLEVNGRPFAKGATERPLVVPRLAEGQLEVKALTRLGDLLRQVAAARKSGSEQFAYRVFGRVELAGYGSLPFDRSGQLPRAALDRFAPR